MNELTKNDNGLCYKELDDFRIGDVFEYTSSRGIIRHYVISFLFKSMGKSFASIIFPDRYSETISTNELNDNKVMSLPDWTFIKFKYPNEAIMYE